MATDGRTYEIIIRPNRSWLEIDWAGLVRYRDLLLLLVRRDFVAKYKQTILGPAWFIIQPLLTTLVFTVIFGKVARISTEGMPPILFYLCALVPWNYFQQNLNTTSGTLVSNAHIFGKVYFPRLIVPLSAALSNMVVLAIQLATFLGFYFYYLLFTPARTLIAPNLMIAVLPLLLLQVVVVSLGFGLLMSASTAKYRDLAHAMGFLVQLWMYATPVVYPLSIVPERWRWVVVLNPMSAVVEEFKFAFLGVGTVRIDYLAISVAISLVAFVLGLLAFSRAERTFIDTV